MKNHTKIELEFEIDNYAVTKPIIILNSFIWCYKYKIRKI